MKTYRETASDLDFSLERAPSHVNKLSERLKGYAAMWPSFSVGGIELQKLLRGGEFDPLVLGAAPLAGFGIYKVAKYSSNDNIKQITDVDENSVEELLEGSDTVKVGATERKIMSLPFGTPIQEYSSYGIVSGENAREIYQDALGRVYSVTDNTQDLGYFTVNELDRGYELWIEKYSMDGGLLDATGFRGAENPAEVLGYTPDSDMEAMLSQSAV